MRPNDAGKPLRIDDFSLYGFDQLQTPLEQALQSVTIRGGEPTVATVADAIFVPAMKVDLHQFEGALLTSDGQPIPRALSQRRKSGLGDIVLGSLSQPVPLAPEQVVEEEVLYLGWYFDHFGHFLLESLARSWMLNDIDPAIKVVFHAQRQPALAGVTLRLLELLGIGRDRILLPEVQTRFRRVIVPEPLYEIAHAAHQQMPRPYRQIAARVVPHDAPTEQPVYLSRRLLSSRQRAIIGEFELEEICRENGFLVVHPETTTLEDQIRLVNRHPTLFTSAGSAAYLPLFALGPSQLHLLTAGVPFPDYFLIPAVAGIAASFANCLAGGDRLSVHYAPLMVKVDDLVGYLDSLGLLKRRLRSSLAARVQDLRPAYDEAWLYRYLSTDARNEALPATIAAQATLRAQSSWPLSLALARHYLGQAPDSVELFVDQFIALVATENDITRLAHFHEDVARGAGQLIRQCGPETAARLSTVLQDRFRIDPEAEEQRQAERRRARQAARPNRATSRPVVTP